MKSKLGRGELWNEIWKVYGSEGQDKLRRNRHKDVNALAVGGGPRILSQEIYHDLFWPNNLSLNLARRIHSKICQGIYIPNHLSNSDGIQIIVHFHHLNLKYKRSRKKKVGDNFLKPNKLICLGRKHNTFYSSKPPFCTIICIRHRCVLGP